MSRPARWMLLAVVAAPAIAYLVYRLARGLGFLDPPLDKQHEHRRAIVVALYAFLLFLPALLYGYEKNWPRAWVVFGVFNALALVFFAVSGIWSARQLWRLRHPDVAGSLFEPSEAGPETALSQLEMRSRDAPLAELKAPPEDSRGAPG